MAKEWLVQRPGLLLTDNRLRQHSEALYLSRGVVVLGHRRGLFEKE